MPNASSTSPLVQWRRRQDIGNSNEYIYQHEDGVIVVGWKELEKEIQRRRERDGRH